jgi:hypothetical protein
VGEREASGDFDYLIGDLTEAPPQSDVSDDDDAPAEPVPADTGAFDAFDADTWYFEPDPPPWYRRKQALAVLIASGAAAAALVIAAVLLIVRSPGGAEEKTTPVEPTATSAESMTSPRQPPVTTESGERLSPPA